MIFLEYNWESLLLLAFTIFLVITDRAFSKKVREDFLLSLLSCVFLILIEQHFRYVPNMGSKGILSVLRFLEYFLRPYLLFLLTTILIAPSKKRKWIYGAPLVLEVVLLFSGLEMFAFIPSCIYGGLLLGSLVIEREKYELSDKVWAGVLCVMLALSIASEAFIHNYAIVNNSMCVITSVFYFYLVIKTYKRDRLTGLLLRHNLNFEMEDNKDNEYILALLDVDNFKMINDKYGHDRGDEVLVAIVKATLANLPRGCRMYRYGGDEFVVLGNNVSREALIISLEKANTQLAADEMRVSYGIANHYPGKESAATITEADMAMYENKRQIKSENIWDDMTGLYNLRGFLEELDHFRKTVNKQEHMVCLVGVDVERLSNINKAFGYAEGNFIIRELAKCLKKCLHGNDFIGHLGSDEFVVAIECFDREDTYIPIFMNRVQESMEVSSAMASKEYSVRLNVDRLFIEVSDDDTSEKFVNDLLYMKQEDKDNRRKNDLTDSEEETNEGEAALVADILDNNKLLYAFQPIVSAKDGSIIAYESLMRSNTEPMISPIKILKYAERSKRSYDVERLTIGNTLEKFEKLTNIPNDVKIFINSIPGHMLNDMDFDILKNRFGNLFQRVVIEITEHGDIEDEYLAVLNSRREKTGFNLAIDDYGSGFSNTTNLLRYMPQVVKLDRMLITGIDRNTKKQFFVNSIISFAKDNDMMTLAEGVETENELKTVIRLGVDMIQGYVTAKPSIDVVTSISDNIKNIIINENLKVGNSQRMVYTAGDNCTLSVVQLAMEDYTKINISAERVTITGSTEYTADMTVKIKENLNCELVLSDVMLNSLDDMPCIELGENTHLKLRIEGTNKLNSRGIYVPDTSSLELVGTGELEISVKGHECYAIGADTQKAFGSITLRQSGTIDINVDGEECVGIGGGTVGEHSQILLNGGTINMTVAGVHAVGVGAYYGSIPIHFVNTDMNAVFRVAHGTLVGTLDGEQDIRLESFNMDIIGSGSDVAVFGTTLKATGKIEFVSGMISTKFSGHIIHFYGGEEGDVNVSFSHAKIVLLGEGDFVTGFGTTSGDASVDIQECAVDFTINASSPVGIGAKEKIIRYIGPEKCIRINGVSEDIA